jgi:hypothetical protein
VLSTTSAPNLHTGSAARAAVLGGSAFLLLTMGGAILGAPVILPLLAWTAVRTPSARLRAMAAVLAALTAAEVAWAAVYLTLGEGQPWIVAVPAVAAILAAAVVTRLARR